MIRRIPARFSVDFSELDGSPTETITTEFWRGTKATRRFKCAARDRFQLIREFLGYRVLNTVYEPHQYTSISNFLVAEEVSTEPFGRESANLGNTKWSNYQDVILTVTYRIPNEVFEGFGGLVTVTETVQEASEFVTAPIKGLYWYDGGNNEPIDEFDAPAKVNRLLEWTYEIRNAVYLPSNIWNHYGKVNNATVYSTTLDTHWAAETLLCGSPTVIRESTYDGTVFNITLRFLIKNNGTFSSPRGWNHFPRISKEAQTEIIYERMVRSKTAPNDASGWKVFYELANFTNLLIP